MAWPSARYKTATNGGSWTPTDMNGLQDQYIRTAGLERDDLQAAIVQQLGLTTTGSGHGGAAVRRGQVSIPGAEGRTNTAYGLLATPDQISSIVLPADGFICVGYRALWTCTASGAGSAAIFLGANQVRQRDNAVSPPVQSASYGIATYYMPLGSASFGLMCGFPAGSASGSDVTTGQILGPASGNGYGGYCRIFAAAGTYTVSIQFKATSGTVTAKERQLWVWTESF